MNSFFRWTLRARFNPAHLVRHCSHPSDLHKQPLLQCSVVRILRLAGQAAVENLKDKNCSVAPMRSGIRAWCALAGVQKSKVILE